MQVAKESPIRGQSRADHSLSQRCGYHARVDAQRVGTPDDPGFSRRPIKGAKLSAGGTVVLPLQSAAGGPSTKALRLRSRVRSAVLMRPPSC
jgi:hypothetical protein